LTEAVALALDMGTVGFWLPVGAVTSRRASVLNSERRPSTADYNGR
jgi:hypothetical protein